MPDVYGVLEELKREWVCHPLNLSPESKRKGLSEGLPRREAGRELPGKWQLRSSATAFSPGSAQLEDLGAGEKPGQGPRKFCLEFDPACLALDANPR